MSRCTRLDCVRLQGEVAELRAELRELTDQVLAMRGERDGHGDKVYERQELPPDVRSIISDVSARTHIPVASILHPPRLHPRGKFRQGHEHCRARWLAIYAVRSQTGATFARIGSWFGQHSGSIVDAYRKGFELSMSAPMSVATDPRIKDLRRTCP